MAAAYLELFCDIVNRKLVSGVISSAAFVLNDLYQGDKLSIRFWPLRPTNAAVRSTFAKVDIDSLSLRLAIGAAAGAESLLASQTTWSKQYDDGAQTGYLYADLDLNTTEMNAAIGSASFITSFIEARLSDSGVERVVFQQAIRVLAGVITPSGSGSLPLPETTYFTQAEVLALFAQLAPNGAGRTITLTSPDGTKQRIIGVNNDGSGLDSYTEA